MKKNKVLPLVFLLITSFTACTKKTTTIVPYPSVSPSGTADVQNYSPYQQGVGANPDYYGNGTSLSDDTSSFDNPTATNPTTGTPVSNNGGTTGSTTDEFGVPNLPDYSPPGGGGTSGGGVTYALAGNIAVDQDSYVPSSIPYIGQLAPSRNQWQAIGVAASGSTIMLTASDKSGLLKKGTAITISAATGKDWKNVGSEYLGTRHKMDATVKGITVDSSGKIYTIDAEKYIYVIPKANTVSKVDAGFSGGLDVVAVSDGLVISTTTGLKKYPFSTITAGTELGAGVIPTGGVGADKAGNVYVVSSNIIKKVTPAGVVSDFTTGVDSALDVTVNNEGKVFVLTNQKVIVFDEAGKQVNTFGEGEFVAPQAIASNGVDIFVSDSGSTYKDSQIAMYS
ncbi:hypothetical protein EON78_05480, partial [bacterium]